MDAGRDITSRKYAARLNKVIAAETPEKQLELVEFFAIKDIDAYFAMIGLEGVELLKAKEILVDKPGVFRINNIYRQRNIGIISHFLKEIRDTEHQLTQKDVLNDFILFEKRAAKRRDHLLTVKYLDSDRYQNAEVYTQQKYFETFPSESVYPLTKIYTPGETGSLDGMEIINYLKKLGYVKEYDFEGISTLALLQNFIDVRGQSLLINIILEAKKKGLGISEIKEKIDEFHFSSYGLPEMYDRQTEKLAQTMDVVTAAIVKSLGLDVPTSSITSEELQNAIDDLRAKKFEAADILKALALRFKDEPEALKKLELDIKQAA
jgi:hypothetical protein